MFWADQETKNQPRLRRALSRPRGRVPKLHVRAARHRRVRRDARTRFLLALAQAQFQRREGEMRGRFLVSLNRSLNLNPCLTTFDRVGIFLSLEELDVGKAILMK
jgi:hypothetical protein